MSARPHQQDGPSCPGCGLPNYSGLCPVCRADEQGYREELQPFFGPWRGDDEDAPNEGLVTVWGEHGRYLGCMGVELWKALLTVEADRG